MGYAIDLLQLSLYLKCLHM